MKLKGLSDQYAIFNHSSFGPVFGGGDNMLVQGSNVHFFSGNTYHPGSLPHGQYTIKEIEVFQLSGSSPSARIATSNGKQSKHTIQVDKQGTRFTDDINEALCKPTVPYSGRVRNASA
jgi:hypothetical protein